jgi:N-acyl homoserine lactone hydrolase
MLGNIGKFPKATIVAQRDEIENAFYPKPGTACCYVPGDFAHLRGWGGNMANTQPTIELRPVEIHREFITAAARWMMAAKL